MLIAILVVAALVALLVGFFDGGFALALALVAVGLGLAGILAWHFVLIIALVMLCIRAIRECSDRVGSTPFG